MIDLPAEQLDAMGISTISCFINMGGKSYSDLDDIFPEDVFVHMERTGEMAKTAAKSPEMYAEFFKPFVDNGDSVIHFAASSGISSICDNARAAGETFNGKVFVIDTLKLSNGIALLADYALALIKAGGKTAAQIAELLRQKVPKIQASFLINTLECLYRGGRCKGMVYYVANIFHIKPVIFMDPKGDMIVREKFHGSYNACLEKYVKATFEKYPNPDLNKLYVICSTPSAELQTRMTELVSRYHAFKEIQFSVTGCNCAVHCGRNTVGIFYSQL
jgi:DegV family protein with EDD domain